MKNLIGERFGRLTVLKYEDNNYCLCKCDCGNEKKVRKDHLLSGNTTSCKCLQRERVIQKCTTHGLRKHKLYTVYRDMLNRCYNIKRKSYKYYGGRGITVCEEWKNSFISFYNWCILNGWNENLEIDRIENNLGYYPSNCRFVTCKQNCRNRRNNIILKYNKQTKTISEWSEEYDIKIATLWARIFISKWSVEESLNTPINSLKKRNIDRFDFATRNNLIRN